LPSQEKRDARHLSADDLVDLMRELALQPYRVQRATTVPFDRKRYENDAEHSFSLGIVALCVAPLMDDDLDVPLACTYALIHDLEEIYAGDTPVYSDIARHASKPERERLARLKLDRTFGDRFPWLIHYIDDYVAMADNESRFVYALDKMLPHATVIIAGYHPALPTRSTYLASERTARTKISAAYPKLTRLFDELCERYVQVPGLFSAELESDDNRGPGKEESAEHRGNYPCRERGRIPEYARQRDQERPDGAGGDLHR
jgi:5'-deoxynucleotidase YfbR-like HD superfamily hydrolase